MKTKYKERVAIHPPPKRRGYSCPFLDKIHALVTENFQLIGLLLSGGQVHDSECAAELLSKVKLENKTVPGDKAFSSVQIRDFIQSIKATACIPDKVNSLRMCVHRKKVV